MPIVRDWDLALDADKVLWGQGANPATIRSRRPSLATVAAEVIPEGVPLLAPAVIYRRISVLEALHERLVLAGGGNLFGAAIASHLSAAREVIVAVCTVGDALSARAAEVFDSDPVRGLALDGLASAAAEALAEAACRHFDSIAGGEGLASSIPLNPGMAGWPLQEAQQQVFSLLPADEIGVTLNPSGLMEPLKSLSLVVGLGRSEDLADGRACDFCTMRETCPRAGKERYAS
jgi:hypothetical protein